MILSFTIDNWMSFRDRVSFSMVASRERQHGERVSKINKYRTRILPIAALYGGNASGKSNFFKAIQFVKKLVVEGTKVDESIPVEPFKLDSTSASQPSSFALELMIDETIYEYSFSVSRKEVPEEKLVRITSSSETVIFERRDGKIVFDQSGGDKFLEFVFRGTRSNQLFLTNSVSQNVDDFRQVYDWFKNNLFLITPESTYNAIEKLINKDSPIYAYMNELLPQLDTGVVKIGGVKFPFESIPFPNEIKNNIQENVRKNLSVTLYDPETREQIIINKHNGELMANKLVTSHLTSDGNDVEFEIRHESDGTQRIIDVLPAFLDLQRLNSNHVYIIDEIDRSLHTLLTRNLLEFYLANRSPESRSQLLFTTHDVLLMDQHLLRRDEMWVTERDNSGATDLISFNEYKDIRFDKDIRKSYLQGRLGGIPRILSGSVLSNQLANKPGN
jgi:uncharacterized protein